MPTPASTQHALVLDLSRYGSGHCFALLHRPDGPARGIVVFAPPFAEELNKSRRMVALQARALAARGLWVLRPDLHGCGDAPGELADATWDGWTAQLAACAAWLRDAAGGPAAGPLWWWGLRHGALLAVGAARRAGPAAGFVFWQPPAQGKPLLQQFLRLRVAAEMVSGEHRGLLAGMKAALDAGQAQQVAGYTLPPAIARGLEAATLAPPDPGNAPAAQVLWLEVSSQVQAAAGAPPAMPSSAADTPAATPLESLPASRPMIARWREAGHAVHTQVVPGPAFWSTTEIETADALLGATTAALIERLGPLAPAATAAPATAALPAPLAADPAEQPLCLDCAGTPMVGVLHRPAQGAPARDTGVVVVVGGPQYRVGSHRQFVHLARALAAAGHPVLRFDVRGMGDSAGAPAGFEHLDDDIDAAVSALHAAQPGLRRTVLWGLCDGASAALMYLQGRADARIGGLALANPWVRSAATQARTLVRHYYWDRIRQPAFWAKLLRGGVAGKALAELRGNLRAAGQRAGAGEATPSFQARMALGWHQARQPLLLLVSGQDYTAREFLDACAAESAWRGALAHAQLTRSDLPEADHTFSGTADQPAAAQATLAWLQRCFAA